MKAAVLAGCLTCGCYGVTLDDAHLQVPCNMQDASSTMLPWLADSSLICAEQHAHQILTCP
jgi:hypothetical protein